jgi:uncharacterized membrane protein
MGVLAGVSFAGGFVFLYVGAWPVFGFLGLDVLLVYWALRKSFEAAEAREIVEVDEHEVVVFRLRPGKPLEELRFPRAWVRVELEEDEERELVGPLTLRFGGRRHEIGRFLGAADRRSLAGALRSAVARPRI